MSDTKTADPLAPFRAQGVDRATCPHTEDDRAPVSGDGWLCVRCGASVNAPKTAGELAELPTLDELLPKLTDDIRIALLGADQTRWRLARACDMLLDERERMAKEIKTLDFMRGDAVATAEEMIRVRRAAQADTGDAEMLVGMLARGDLEESNRGTAATRVTDSIAALRARVADHERALAAARREGADEERAAWFEVTGADTADALAAEVRIAKAKRGARPALPHPWAWRTNEHGTVFLSKTDDADKAFAFAYPDCASIYPVEGDGDTRMTIDASSVEEAKAKAESKGRELGRITATTTGPAKGDSK